MPSALQTSARSVAVWAESAGVTRAPSAKAVISGAGVRMAKLRNEWSLDLPGLRARSRRGVRPVRTHQRPSALSQGTNKRYTEDLSSRKGPVDPHRPGNVFQAPHAERRRPPARARLRRARRDGRPGRVGLGRPVLGDLRGVLIRSSWDYHL